MNEPRVWGVGGCPACVLCTEDGEKPVTMLGNYEVLKALIEITFAKLDAATEYLMGVSLSAALPLRVSVGDTELTAMRLHAGPTPGVEQSAGRRCRTLRM